MEEEALPVSDAYAISIIARCPIHLRQKVYQDDFKAEMSLKGQRLVESKYLTGDFSKSFEPRRIRQVAPAAEVR